MPPSSPFQSLACPLDGGELRRTGTMWRCAAGHSFDVAREGYINLLPVQQKRSRDPGDSKEMVAARRRFLNAGHYAPIAAMVARAVLADGARTSAVGKLACLDAGCGEGYYLRQLAAASEGGPALDLIGLDISKWAIQAAARQYRSANWIVGTNARLPVLPKSLDRVLCLFGFPVHTEFARVLKPGGQLLQVDAGQEHLRELREIIYPALKAGRDAEAPTPEGFARLNDETLCYPLELPAREHIADLLLMTPHFFKASTEGRLRAMALDSLMLTVDVRLTRFERLAD